MEDSDTLANVVVSDSQNLPDATEDEEGEDDLEETTERAVLRDENNIDDKDYQHTGSTNHGITGAEDDTEGEGNVGAPLYDKKGGDFNFDEEATQVSDLNLKNPLPLGKPQMAESRKVKNKHRKFGLLGIFKKSKK